MPFCFHEAAGASARVLSEHHNCSFHLVLLEIRNIPVEWPLESDRKLSVWQISNVSCCFLVRFVFFPVICGWRILLWLVANLRLCSRRIFPTRTLWRIPHWPWMLASLRSIRMGKCYDIFSSTFYLWAESDYETAFRCNVIKRNKPRDVFCVLFDQRRTITTSVLVDRFPPNWSCA